MHIIIKLNQQLMKFILKNSGEKNFFCITNNKKFFRKEERITRVERELADEKKKSERLLDNMVTSSIHLYSSDYFL
jgi:hypothetical protein